VLTLVPAPTGVSVDDTWLGTTSGSDPANNPTPDWCSATPPSRTSPAPSRPSPPAANIIIYGGSYAATVNVNKTLAGIETRPQHDDARPEPGDGRRRGDREARTRRLT